MVLHRHRCGIIYSQVFADFLHERHTLEAPSHPDELLSLDYIHCLSGPQAGNSWYQLTWIPALSIPLIDRFLLASVPLHIHPQTRRALRKSALHIADGHVRILR
jgi:hypothetical protein